METVAWEDREGARWITLEGELDNEAVLGLRDRFEEAVAGGEGDVVVVVAGVTFLSSMAVGLLLKARETLAAKDRTLKLAGLKPKTRRILDLMNLTGVFDET